MDVFLIEKQTSRWYFCEIYIYTNNPIEDAYLWKESGFFKWAWVKQDMGHKERRPSSQRKTNAIRFLRCQRKTIIKYIERSSTTTFVTVIQVTWLVSNFVDYNLKRISQSGSLCRLDDTVRKALFVRGLDVVVYGDQERKNQHELLSHMTSTSVIHGSCEQKDTYSNHCTKF